MIIKMDVIGGMLVGVYRGSLGVRVGITILSLLSGGEKQLKKKNFLLLQIAL